VQLQITHFTDPACPFAFSAEPIRRRLRWYYGEQLTWHTRMIVLTLEPGEAENLAGEPDLSNPGTACRSTRRHTRERRRPSRRVELLSPRGFARPERRKRFCGDSAYER